MAAISNAGRIGVWGASGSGKSSKVKQMLRGRSRLVIFDPMEEYPKALPGLRYIEHQRATDLDKVRVAMRENWSGFKVAYKPPSGYEPDALSKLCRLLLAAQKPFKDGKPGAKMMTLVVEEMNNSFPVSSGVKVCPGFAEICSRGRHFGIEVIGVSQRIAEVATRFRANTDETIVLRQKGPNDIKAAANELGTTEAQVRTLKNLEFLHEKAGEITPGKITFPRARKKT